ncbi:hypothetical protein ES708_10132 [subsurface metagenome]
MRNKEEAIMQGEPIYYAHTLDTEFDEVLIVPMSDAHYGNPLFSKKHFMKTLNFLEKPNAYGFLNGDLLESTLRTSKGEIYNQVKSPEKQRDQMIKWLEPYKDKLFGATDGNHENRIWREVGVHMTRDIATKLGIPYRPEGLLHKVSFGSGNSSHKDKPYVFWFYQTHGYGGARTKSAKAVKVERTATWIHADFYAMSHDHVVNVAPDVYLLPDPRTHNEKDEDGNETGFRVGRVHAHRKMLIKTNAYLKWGGYSEFGGFPPTDMATPLIRLLTPYSKHWEDLPDRPRRAVKVEV